MQELMRELDIVNKIYEYAREEAARTGWMSITTEHLLLGMIRHGRNEACRFLTDSGIPLDELKSMILDEIDRGYPVPYQDTGRIQADAGLQHVIETASGIMRSPKAVHIPGTMVLLSVILKEDNTPAAAAVCDLGLDFNGRYSEYPEDAYTGAPLPEDDPDDMDYGAPSGNRGESPEETLRRFGTDLTAAAEEGELDPVTGRCREIDRAIDILCRRKKNNPMIVGEPGVGKTALAEGIAMRIAGNEVPAGLLGKKIVSLDMAALVAGTKYRGDFEERLRRILEAVRNHPDIILFIDEIHNIVGTGGGGGSMDAAAILKPALSRGDFQCIGTTTSDEYRRIIEKDGALARRFQKVLIEQPTPAMTIEILDRLRPHYEQFHNVVYTPEAVRACVSLSVRYMTGRNLPDKAIDLMDEAGAAVHASATMPDSGLKEMNSRLQELRKKKREYLENSDFEMGAETMQMELRQQHDIEEATARLKDSTGHSRATVTEEDIMRTMSVMTGIPVEKMAASETSRLAGLRQVLSKRIIGQDEAVDKVVRAISRNRAGLRDPGRPIGSFLFLGPTGVGKTHLAKTLAAQLFDTGDAIIRLDMSEYMEKISVTRLIGAPPGYVGYDEGGQLSERVRQKPYSVVLLDEIEKAHPDVFNILLQILDEGRLTDSNGRIVDFRNTVIILTSNIGSRDIKDFGRGIGFGSSGEVSQQHQKALIDKALRRSFTPEFLNRLDETVYFRSLTRTDVSAILDIELETLHRRVAQAGYSLHLSTRAREFLCDKGYDPAYGARPLKRAVRRYLEDLIAETVISGLRPASRISVDVNEDNTALTVTGSSGNSGTSGTDTGGKKDSGLKLIMPGRKSAHRKEEPAH